VIVLGDNVLSTRRGKLLDLAAKARMPAMHPAKTDVVAGGLMSYATDQNDLFRRSAREAGLERASSKDYAR
jgi:hypothetical protein